MAKLSDAEVHARYEAARSAGPQVGQVWEHKGGGRYLIVARPLREADLSPEVVYVALADGTTWTRPAAEFGPPRFRRVED